MTVKQTLTSRCIEIVRYYGLLGFYAFGGPSTHVLILRRLFVTKLKWVDEETFKDLFSIGNALPGPGSTQLAFSIALVRSGVIPALLAFLLWSLPGAIGMLALGFGVRKIPATLPAVVLAMLSGLNAAAVGLIALAAYKLSSTTATDKVTLAVLFVSGATAVCYESKWLFPVLVVAGGLTTLIWDRRAALKRRRDTTREATRPDTAEQIPDRTSQDIEMAPVQNTNDASTVVQRKPPSVAEVQPPSEPKTSIYFTISLRVAIALLLAFIGLLVSVIVVRGSLHPPPRPLDVFVNFLIAGSIIFGGGPVVVPLLQGYTESWVNARDFLLGFSILQAFPGPNFNFAVYLGVLSVPTNPVLGAVLGYIGIFLPGILLKLAFLQLYSKIREHPTTRQVLRGVNAAAVGFIWSATWRLWNSGVVKNQRSTASSLDADPWWAVIAAGAFTLCEWYSVSPPIAVILGAVGGIVWWAVRLSEGIDSL